MRCRCSTTVGSWLAVATAAAGLALVGCTANSGELPDDDLPVDEPPAAVESEPVEDVEPAPEPPTDEDMVAASYVNFLTALTAAMEAGDPDLTNLSETATGEGLRNAQALVVSLLDQDRIARGSVVPSIETIRINEDSATVEDCYRLDLVEHDADTGEQIADRGGARFQASATLERSPDDRWVVVEFDEGDACAPSEIATTVADRYLAFWDAVWAAADPPDPDHPGLADTAVGEHLAGLQAQLTDLRDNGHVRRGRGTEHPVVVYLTDHDTQALVRDCIEENPDTGVYDAASGELIDGSTDEGQRTLLETRLELLDGAWRVVNVRVEEEDSSCEPGAA